MLILDGTWKLNDFDPGKGVAAGAMKPEYYDSLWDPVEVPGDVHMALIEAGHISHPFDDQNVEACAWVEQKEWWYRRNLDIPNPLPGQRMDLVFDGIDTLSDIYLNGEKIGETSNMFTPYRFDVTDKLKPGQPNLLAICIHPIVAAIEARDSEKYWAPFYVPRVWARKAQMSFGWDWGPRLVTAGLWRGARLEAHNHAVLVHPYARTVEISDGEAALELSVRVRHTGEPAENEKVTFTIRRNEQEWQVDSKVNEGNAVARILIKDPDLWWTYELGEAALYTLETVLSVGDEPVHESFVRFGIRTIELDQSPGKEQGTKNFTVVLNGMKVFCRGANWIPASNFIGSIPDERYQKLLTQVWDANMNMVRVWGGGIYEKPAFYNMCDELGILVWQDFMFCCGAYPDDDEDFLAEVQRETPLVLFELRNHPSIALWCGNNENQWIDSLEKGTNPGSPLYGQKIYDEVLPRACKKHDPSRPYWPGSPFGGNDANSDKEGDKHNWQVWGGHIYPRKDGEEHKQDTSPEGISYRHYENDMARFSSEFGIHASPDLRTLRRHITTGGLAYGNDQHTYRIKDWDPTRKETMMEAHIGLPTDIEQYALYSQLVQAHGLKFAIEHYRRRKFECSGALIWQLNDCWPGISWSVLDYYSIPKGAYYYLKRAFSPILYSFQQEVDGKMSLWGINDTPEAIENELWIRRFNFKGIDLYGDLPVVNVPANSSVKLLDLPEPDDPCSECYVVQVEEGPESPDNFHFFTEFKDLALGNVTVDAMFTEGRCRLDSNYVVPFVHLVFPQDDVVASDNYILLIPGEPRWLDYSLTDHSEASKIKIKGFNLLSQ